MADTVKCYVEFANEHDASEFLIDCAIWQKRKSILYPVIDSGYLED